MNNCSILIVTRNRPQFLDKIVFNSLKKLNTNNYDLVVCDNNSDKRTEKIVSQFKKNFNNLKYFKSKKWIQKELFFEWAIKKVKTKFFFFLFDDDVLLKGSLERIQSLIKKFNKEKIITFNSGITYFYRDYPVKKEKNKLNILKFTSKIYKYSSKDHLDKIYNHNEIFSITPMVTNAVYNTKFIKNIIKNNGKLFHHGHMGDYDIAIQTLAKSKNFVFYDFPLILFGHWSKNTSSQLHDFNCTMREYKIWIKSFSKKLSKLEIPYYLWPNCIYFSLKNLQKISNIKFRQSKQEYVSKLLYELHRLKNSNIKLPYNLQLLNTCINNYAAKYKLNTKFTKVKIFYQKPINIYYLNEDKEIFIPMYDNFFKFEKFKNIMSVKNFLENKILYGDGKLFYSNLFFSLLNYRTIKHLIKKELSKNLKLYNFILKIYLFFK